MKIGINIITGVWKYSPTAIYTENDLIIANGKLYSCRVQEAQSVDITVDSRFKDYLQIGSILDLNDYIDSVDNGVEKSIPSSLLKTVINSYIGGLEGDRSITTITGSQSLDSITDTFIGAISQDHPELPPSFNSSDPTYLFLCTKASSGTMQVIIECKNATMFTRTYTGTWSSWSSFAPASNLTNALNGIDTAISEIASIKSGYADFVNNSEYVWMEPLFSTASTSTTSVNPSIDPNVRTLYVEVANTSDSSYKVISIPNINMDMAGSGYTVRFQSGGISIIQSGSIHYIRKIFVSKSNQ